MQVIKVKTIIASILRYFEVIHNSHTKLIKSIEIFLPLVQVNDTTYLDTSIFMLILLVKLLCLSFIIFSIWPYIYTFVLFLLFFRGMSTHYVIEGLTNKHDKHCKCDQEVCATGYTHISSQ
jgi:hypothetical protein